jgi:hypothetical protein
MQGSVDYDYSINLEHGIIIDLNYYRTHQQVFGGDTDHFVQLRVRPTTDLSQKLYLVRDQGEGVLPISADSCGDCYLMRVGDACRVNLQNGQSTEIFRIPCQRDMAN